MGCDNSKVVAIEQNDRQQEPSKKQTGPDADRVQKNSVSPLSLSENSANEVIIKKWDPECFYVETGDTPPYIRKLWLSFHSQYDRNAASQPQNELGPDHILRSHPYSQKTEAWARYHFLVMTKMFEKYRSQSVCSGAPDDPTRFHAGGFVPLAEDLGIDLANDNITLFVVCYQFKCQHSWEMSLDEWVLGMATAKCFTITALKMYVTKWSEKLTNPHASPTSSEEFRHFYRFVFHYNRESNARYVETSAAVPFWQPLLKGRWDDADLWCAYLLDESNTRYNTISPDQWQQLLEFVIFHKGKSVCATVHDPMQAWPCLIDDYVEWAQARGSMSMTADASSLAASPRRECSK